MKPGPVPDRMSIWPFEDGRYGLDAVFQGSSGYQRAEVHMESLRSSGVPHSFHQELGGSWSVRFGPLNALEIGETLSAFVR